MRHLTICLLTLTLCTSVAQAQSYNAFLGVTRQEIAAMQTCLIAVGYNPGPVDGLAGERTVRAFITWFEARHVEGAPPDQTLKRMALECYVARGGSVPDTGSRLTRPRLLY